MQEKDNYLKSPELSTEQNGEAGNADVQTISTK